MNFFDTNILVYRQDPLDTRRQQIAKDLIEAAMLKGTFVISTQVLQEFYNTMLRRRFMPAATAQALCELWAEHDVVNATPSLLFQAFALQQRYQTSLWDALIVQAALDGGCTTLFAQLALEHLADGAARQLVGQAQAGQALGLAHAAG
jgi:predicted nucleic acid-binding protein